jgi:hypothetical protein
MPRLDKSTLIRYFMFMRNGEILKRGTPPLPYEEGNHCMFYAAQDALLHFQDRGLTSEVRKRFKTDENLRQQTQSGRVYEAAIEYLSSFLNEQGINTDHNSDPVVERLPLRGHSQRKILMPQVEFPGLVFSFAPGLGHVWFSPSREGYIERYEDQMPVNSIIASTIALSLTSSK